MNVFVSYELLDAAKVVLSVGQVVLTGTDTASLTADLEAIKNDCGHPEAVLRVLCLTVLP